MKTSNIIVVILFLLIDSLTQAQFWRKVTNTAEATVKETVIRKTVEKVANTRVQVMDNILEDKMGKKGNSKMVPYPSYPDDENSEFFDEEDILQETQPWSKYNFVPGDEIIFQDDLSNEENGEFPSRWDLVEGNAENASFEEENIINLKNKSIINPLMDEKEYLPEVFTIEFDAYFGGDPGSFTAQYYSIRFAPGAGGWYYPVTGSEDWYYPLNIYRHGAQLSAEINGAKKEFETYEESLKEAQPVWRHIAMAFSKRSLKVFVDQHRVLNIPNLGFQPKMFSIAANSYQAEDVRALKNIRVAQGGKKLYDEIVAEGKFVTRGILFDVNKASLKPESMGVINEVAKMMQEHQDLNFSIEGHTDANGDEDYNQQLSEERALAVKQALTAAGIEASRMETKGMGESVPVADNASPEGRANNRRVVFLKI